MSEDARNATARIMLVGDNVAVAHPGGLASFYPACTPLLRSADVVFGNLEWPTLRGLTVDPRRYGRRHGYMTADDVRAMANAGFSVVSLANNHAMDAGPEGLLETIAGLDEFGIEYCGAGADRARAHRPVVVVRNQIRIAFLAYTAVYLLPGHPLPPRDDEPQMSTLEVSTRYEIPHRLFEVPGTPPIVVTTPDPIGLAAVEAEIAAAKCDADVVIVSWHWGLSRGYRKRVEYQDVVAHACIDAGASLVVGHHPHVLQGIETRERGAVCYSLGDFVYWVDEPPNANHDRYTVVIDCVVDADGLVSLSAVPCIFDDQFHPVPVQDDRGGVVFDALVRESTGLAAELSFRSGRVHVDLKAATNEQTVGHQ